ncbi:MAG: hypothetical protein J7L55_04130, partial [Desulfurococcales archaeon]|nr:hypothetical protein [Desulfurococcales archaeon]
AVMINQWPDRYYHSDLDTIDKFDSDVAEAVACAVGSAAYFVSVRDVPDYVLKAYIHEYLGSEAGRTSDELAGVRYAYLCNTLRGKYPEALEGMRCPELPDLGGDREKYVYVGPEEIVDIRCVLRVLSPSTSEKLKAELSELKVQHGLIAAYVPLALREKCGLRELKLRVLGEFGLDVTNDVLMKALNYLIRAGLVKQV